MNDTLIIVICIFLMSVIWNFYFKIKEGIENVDNYVMPISFSNNRSTNPSRDESKTIHIPEQVTSAGDLNLMKNTNLEGALNVKSNADIQGPLLVKGTTTLEGNVVEEIKNPKGVPIHFGVGENKEGNAGKISYGSYDLNDTLSIVGGGNGPRKVKVWDDLNVGSNLSVNGNTTTTSLNVNGAAYINNATMNTLNVNGNIDTKKLNVNGTSNIIGIQCGKRGGGLGANERVAFPTNFPNNNVFVIATPSEGNWDEQTTIRIVSSDSGGFSYEQRSSKQYREDSNRYIRGIQSYDLDQSQLGFTWIAFCIG
jgi:hypothetical protein